MSLNLRTPGVYTVEKSKLGDSISQTSTAVAVFIGYTAKASVNGKSFHMVPVVINSLSEYELYFGKQPNHVFSLTETDKRESDINIDGKSYNLVQNENSKFYLYYSLKLFFDNGGSRCYVISIGQYEEDPDELEISKDRFNEAIDKLKKEDEPTIIVMPDSLLLSEEDGSYYSVVTHALSHCAETMNKVALFDVYGADKELPLGEDKNKYIKRFRENAGLENLSYGACYYPWLVTNIVTQNDINYSYFDLELLKPIIEEKYQTVLDNLIKATDEGEKKYWDRGLNGCKEYVALKKIIASKLGILPAAPAVAGLYTKTDNTQGVWIAPANKNLNSVIEPTIKISNEEQENLNIDPISGKSINAIRTFRGRGCAIVWGARTLDGNSPEWRYVNVKRLFISIEKSIATASAKVVFKPNVAMTWSIVKASINNYLTDLWRKGALVGAIPSEAFSVLCGLGETMDQNDINEGIMRIQVAAAPSRPAEFIVISFEQKMQGK